LTFNLTSAKILATLHFRLSIPYEIQTSKLD
jgi:hypothetical protein